MSTKQANQPVEIGGSDYETVDPAQNAQVLGGAGAKGDFIARLALNVFDTANASVVLFDGITPFIIQTSGNTQTGPRVVELGMRSKTGPWKLTTGAGVRVIAIGQFSA